MFAKFRSSSPRRWRVVLWLAGVVSLIWFLARVIPKPSRASYPCQRAAFPVASAFVLYLAGLATARLAWLGAARRWRQRRWALSGLLLAAAAGGLLVSEWIGTLRAPAAITSPIIPGPFVPADGANNPMGTGLGIHPGRVAWVHDPGATNWSPAWDNRTDIYYWDDQHTNQLVVNGMMRRGLVALTGEATEAAAWDKLFHHFNAQHGRGSIGYTAGEKVFIKTNHVEQRSHDDVDNLPDMSPQMEVALLDSIIDAGVPESAITIGDPARDIADKSYTRMHARHPGVTYLESNFFTSDGGTAGRVKSVNSPTKLMHYSGRDLYGQPFTNTPLPMEIVNATYVINLAIMKGHNRVGVTLCGKNWYGCFCESPAQESDGNGDYKRHNVLSDQLPQAAKYRVITDLMAHPQLGGKTMLFVLDGLWGFPRYGTGWHPAQWHNAPFNGDYPSSLLVSQDPVAIDSVALDFLRAEFAADMGASNTIGNAAIDDYLHEAAQISAAPSGTKYDPAGTGTPVSGSLGVHEHWNNASDKKYSRNLGLNKGIELVALGPNGVGGWEKWK